MALHLSKNMFLCGIFGNIQFVIVSTIAMFFYSGGTAINPSTTGYSFWSNFFSDLGRIKSYSGALNTISCIMFVILFFIWGFAIIIFYIGLPSIFTESRNGKWTCFIGSIWAFIGGIAAIGVAFTPNDIIPLEHFIFAATLYFAIMLAEFCTAIAIFLTKRFPKKYAFSLLISAILLLFYIIIIIIGPLFLTPEWLETYVVGQKMSFYGFIIALGATAYGAWKLSDKSAV